MPKVPAPVPVPVGTAVGVGAPQKEKISKKISCSKGQNQPFPYEFVESRRDICGIRPSIHPAECGGSFVGRGLRRSFRSLRKAATVYKPVHQCKLLAGVATLEYSMKPASTYAHSSPCTNRPVTCTKCGFIFHDLVVLNEGPLERQARRRGAADYARAGGGVALPREGGHGAAPLQALREERQGCVPRTSLCMQERPRPL